jgi:hypothetical protein
MGEKLDDRELFKRLAKSGEQFDEDWIDALHEKVRDEGDVVAEKQWDSRNPGVGAGSFEVYAFQDLFFVDDDSVMAPTKLSPTRQDDCVLLEVKETLR